MKVRHIRRKPWTRKGPAQRRFKRYSRSLRRRAVWAAKLIEDACRAYIVPIYPSK